MRVGQLVVARHREEGCAQEVRAWVSSGLPVRVQVEGEHGIPGTAPGQTLVAKQGHQGAGAGLRESNEV
jgi:hypothetical protein